MAVMPDNRNTQTAWSYHNATKHSYASIRANPHFLDFANQPVPFKIYPALEPSRLPSQTIFGCWNRGPMRSRKGEHRHA